MMTTDNLKVGDRVGVGGGGWNPVFTIRTVAKRTATQVVLDDGSRWTRRGYRVGEAARYTRDFLVSEQEANERNEDARKKQERSALIREVRDTDFRAVSDEGLRLILQILKEHKCS